MKHVLSHSIISVVAAPVVQVAPATLEVLVGSTATFTCLVSGDPPPTVSWLDSRSVDVLDSGDTRIQVRMYVRADY